MASGAKFSRYGSSSGRSLTGTAIHFNTRTRYRGKPQTNTDQTGLCNITHKITGIVENKLIYQIPILEDEE